MTEPKKPARLNPTRKTDAPAKPSPITAAPPVPRKPTVDTADYDGLIMVGAIVASGLFSFGVSTAINVIAKPNPRVDALHVLFVLWVCAALIAIVNKGKKS